VDYEGDGAKFLKLTFGFGEIDFIVAQTLTSSPTIEATVDGQSVLLETIPEIIAKKIYHRGANIKPRDIFDIAAGSKNGCDLDYRGAALLSRRGREDSDCDRQTEHRIREQRDRAIVHQGTVFGISEDGA
jgi:Nucleotidyl transferase AbiEii toxin, Type IV TA system